MADKKVTELTALARASGDDLLLVVNDPSGTPASRKLTVAGFFANVQPDAVFDGRVTISSNSFIRGTVCTVSANVNVTSTLTVNTYNVESELLDRMQVANTTTLINKYLTVANAIADYVSVDQVNDRMQVANTLTLVNDRLQVANAQVYLTVANAAVQYANSDNSVLTGTTTAKDVSCNTITIAANTGLLLAGGGLTTAVPASSNALVEDIRPGTIWYSNNHLYIAVDLETIKRVNLDAF